MSLIDQRTLSEDETYRKRVAVAVDIAMASTAQESTSGNIVKDQLRKQLVFNYVNNVDGGRELIIENFVQLSVTNPTISAYAPTQSSVPDGDIQFAVNSFFDAVAGVNINNPNI
jgi:hypothetical protein